MPCTDHSWGEFKAFMKYSRGTTKELLPGHLDEFVYKKCYLYLTEDYFSTFLTHLAECRVSRKPPRPTTLDLIKKNVCLYNYNFGITLVQHSPDVVLMSLVYWVAIDPLDKHVLMLGHCLRRLPNFNPSMGLNASCFWCIRKHLPVISPGIGLSLAGFIQSHALAPASQAVGQRYRRWASINPTLV